MINAVDAAEAGRLDVPQINAACAASVRLDQYLNALGEGIVIPGQAKYASIFNVSGSVRFQFEIF